MGLWFNTKKAGVMSYNIKEKGKIISKDDLSLVVKKDFSKVS